MNAPTPNAQIKPGAPSGLSQELQSILQAGAAAAASSEPPESSSTVSSAAPPQDFEVDLGGGVKRRVPVKDMVGAYLQKSQLDQDREALDRRFAEAGQMQALQALRDRLASLPADRRAQVLQMLEGQAAAQPGAEDDDVSSALGEALDDTRKSDEPDWARQLRTKLDKHDQVLNVLADHVAPQIHSARQATVAERVSALMQEFPVFKGDPGGSEMAKSFIVSQLAANPRANLEDLVQKTAARLVQVHTQRDAKQREESQTRTNPMANVPKGTATAGGLKTGKVRQAALAYLNRENA